MTVIGLDPRQEQCWALKNGSSNSENCAMRRCTPVANERWRASMRPANSPPANGSTCCSTKGPFKRSTYWRGIRLAASGSRTNGLPETLS